MSDIDFDELDKAVNNLMGNVSDKDKEPVADDTVDIDSTVDSDETSTHDESTDSIKETTDDEDTSEAEEVPEPSPVPSMPRPKQNPGRFMDVVHPSANMRIGQTVSPSAAFLKQTTEKDTADKNEESDDTEPQTPFLPDANAKVNKRPLGSMSWPFGRQTDDKTDDQPEESPKRDEPVTTDDEPEPEVVETVAINSEEEPEHKEEKGLDAQPLDPTHIDAEPTDEERQLQSIESMEVEGVPVDDGEIQKVESGDTGNLRNDQDGKDDHKKSDDTENPSGSIYDVNNYHQPLGHPAKQKSGWGTVIIILSIIVICVAIGAAVFFVFGGGL